MSESLSDEIKTDFVNELKDYIPLIRDKVNKLQGSAEPDTEAAELYRLVHAIRGASALVKLNNLSEVAAEFEEVIEDIIAKRSTFSPSIYEAFTDAIGYLSAYAKESPCNDSFNQNMKAEVLNALHGVRKIAKAGDEQDLLARLFKDADIDTDGTLLFDTSDSSLTNSDNTINDQLVGNEKSLALMPEQTHNRDERHTNEEATPDGKNALTATNQVGVSIESQSIDLPQQELLEDFYQEAEDHMQDLGKAIGEIEAYIKSPTAITAQHKELLRLIRRSVHTIKGAAAVIKLTSIASWGHEFENVLDWLYEKADFLTPQVVRTIADAADILEYIILDPKKIDAQLVDRLKLEFEHIIATNQDEENNGGDEKTPDLASPSNSADFVEVLLPKDNQMVPDVGGESKSALKQTSGGLDPAKTIRIDMSKVASLVKLGGELTIALSAFDQDMDGLGNLIGETDRTQYRLKNTARDLELGYEARSIEKIDDNRATFEKPQIVSSEETDTCSDFDLLELDRFSELSLIIGTLNETAADAGTIAQQLSNIYSGFETYINRLRILLRELNEKTMHMRMTPMSSITYRMRRTVRETADQLNKNAQLTIQGEHIELNKRVWENLADPIMHLLRNAIDHGVESQAARRDTGKPEIANIQLEAAYQGNQVVIRITDDGKGLNYEAIRKAVGSTNGGKDAESMTEEELADMIFQSGFSTRQSISEISGRGVGLDVVRENILNLDGAVRVETSQSGIGTTFHITLPLDMAVMKALIFDVGGQRYATALYDIKEILRVNPKEITSRKGKTINIGGRRLPYYVLSEYLINSGFYEQSGSTKQWPLFLIIDSDSWQGAIAIDSIISQRDIVIKSLGTHLGKVTGISGATVMGDGKVLPILNLIELLSAAAKKSTKPYKNESKSSQRSLEIMVVDDSVTIRNVVSRLMKRQGWKVQTAKDGVEAIEMLHTQQPDVIILDIEMPRMNGYEFMSSIRSRKNFKDLPVIMHTSRASDKHRKKAEVLGVNAFVTKPYEEEDFITLIKKLGDLS